MKKTVTIVLIAALQLLVFGMVTNRTLAADKAEHILTYKNQKLIWDNNTEVVDSVARLSIFSDSYHGVKSAEKVVAPGTEGSCVVRLKNESRHEVEYKAVIYKKDDTPLIINGTEDEIVKTGKLSAEELLNLNIDWKWIFEEDDERDTALGNKINPDKTEIFVDISIFDDGKELSVQTGDNNVSSLTALVIAVIVCCVIILCVIAWEDRRREKRAS